MIPGQRIAKLHTFAFLDCVCLLLLRLFFAFGLWRMFLLCLLGRPDTMPPPLSTPLIEMGRKRAHSSHYSTGLGGFWNYRLRERLKAVG